MKKKRIQFLHHGMVMLLALMSCKAPKDEPEEQSVAIAKRCFAFKPYSHSVDFIMHQTIDTVLLGDMNGNGLTDTAIIYSPIFARPHPRNEDLKGGCENDECITTVTFNFTEKKIVKDNSIGFQNFFATEDLDNDGIKEIAFVPLWFNSCWNSLYLYTYRNGEWQLMISGSVYACYEDGFSDRIKKIGAAKFAFTAAKWNEDHGMETDTTLIFSSSSKLPILF